MKKILILCLVFVSSVAIAQDVTVAYDASEITGYICVNRVSENTYGQLREKIDSLGAVHHSANYILDMLHAEGDYGMNAVVLADSLLRHRQRFAFLIGRETGGAAEQVAMFLQNAHRAITAGDVTPGGLVPDMQYETNDSWKTAWFDSICAFRICEKTAREYARKCDVKAQYGDAEDFLKNFKETGDLTTLLNEVAEREGIRENYTAYFYSGFMTVTRARAELIRVVYPESVSSYHKALNAHFQQVISDAAAVLESPRYREMINW